MTFVPSYFIFPIMLEYYVVYGDQSPITKYPRILETTHYDVLLDININYQIY